SSGSSAKKSKLDQLPAANLDADDPADDDDESDDSDDDNTAELMAELNRIKKERAQEEERKEAERKAQEEKIRTENILSGNPLLSGKAAEFKVKRRWDDDVVFKNCATEESDQVENVTCNYACGILNVSHFVVQLAPACQICHHNLLAAVACPVQMCRNLSALAELVCLNPTVGKVIFLFHVGNL
ncbi:hypothetical protein CEXT_590381, partial [Caerostris extrusa]